LKFKDGKSIEQAADEVLRGYLIQCYATISKQYPPIAGIRLEQNGCSGWTRICTLCSTV